MGKTLIIHDLAMIILLGVWSKPDTVKDACTFKHSHFALI